MKLSPPLPPRPSPSLSGAWVGVLGGGAGGAGRGELRRPASVAADKDGLVFVGEEGNARVSVFREDTGAFVCWLGGPQVWGAGAYPGLGLDAATGAIAIYSGARATAWVQGLAPGAARDAAPPPAPPGFERGGAMAAAPPPPPPGGGAAPLAQLLEARAKFVDDNLSAGLRPTAAQIASFLRELVVALRPFVADAPQALGVLSQELQDLGWDAGKNQPTSATPPTPEDLLAFLRRASARSAH